MRRVAPVLVGLIVLVLGVIAVWWTLPERWLPDTPDPEARVVRPEPRPAWTRVPRLPPRGITLPPASDLAAAPEPEPDDTGLVDTGELPQRGPGIVSGWVVDARGTNVGGGGVAMTCRSVDVITGDVLDAQRRYRARAADDGFFEITVDAPAECRLTGMRLDGLLMARSRSVEVWVEPDDLVELDLVVPAERTGGLGVQIREHPDGIGIERVHEGTPAWDAGLVAGDVIVAVDGEPAVDQDLDGFIQRATGPVGSDVDITVLRRDGSEVPMTLERRFLDRGLIR